MDYSLYIIDKETENILFQLFRQNINTLYIKFFFSFCKTDLS